MRRRRLFFCRQAHPGRCCANQENGSCHGMNRLHLSGLAKRANLHAHAANPCADARSSFEFLGLFDAPVKVECILAACIAVLGADVLDRGCRTRLCAFSARAASVSQGLVNAQWHVGQQGREPDAGPVLRAYDQEALPCQPMPARRATALWEILPNRSVSSTISEAGIAYAAKPRDLTHLASWAVMRFRAALTTP